MPLHVVVLFTTLPLHVPIPCPAFNAGFAHLTGKAKYGAWEKNKGKSKETAMEEYIM